MGAISYRHNQGNVILNRDGVVDGFGVSSDTIPALMRDGTEKFMKFGGFINNVEILHVQRVKLLRIMAWTNDDFGLKDWKQIPPDSYVDGLCLHSMYYVRLYDGKPRYYKL